MPDWADKWDLEHLDEARGDWRGCPVPLPEVLAEVESWQYSRQDNPRGTDVEPYEHEEPELAGYFPVRARVFGPRQRPILIESRPVVCYYEIQEQEHRVVFSHFGVL